MHKIFDVNGGDGGGYDGVFCWIPLRKGLNITLQRMSYFLDVFAFTFDRDILIQFIINESKWKGVWSLCHSLLSLHSVFSVLK